MTKVFMNGLRLFVCAAFTAQLMGCGTLMYPERRGQRGGRLDVGVTVLDAVGLLFFVIPGVIAFCVDFSNGTIYLPERGLRVSLNIKNLRMVKFDPKDQSMANIERIVKNETGYDVKLDKANVKMAKVKSVNEMMVQFAKNPSDIQNERIALL
jgi:hypothetical protein